MSTSKKLRPLSDRVLVRRRDPEKTSRGGIIIPDNVQSKSQEGEVIAVGPGRVFSTGQRVELSVKPGDVVLFDKYAGAEVTINGESYLAIVEENIYGVVEQA